MDILRSLPLKIKMSDATAKRILESDPNSVNIAESVQLLKVGRFHTAKFGEIVITKAHLRSMVKNFENGVRGIDIAVDYKHESDDVAAGWIDTLSLQENDTELWADVLWTPKALRKLGEKEFRYLSADFHMDYQDNETLKKFGPTLLGAGLTNRPVVKRMSPAVQLHEGGSDMDNAEMEKKISDLEADNKKLSDANKGLKSEKVELTEDRDKRMKELQEELDKLRKEKQKSDDGAKEAAEKAALSEKETEFNAMLSEGKACEAQRKSYLEDDTKAFAEAAKEMNTKAAGNSGDKKDVKVVNKDSKTPAQDEIMILAEKKLVDTPNEFKGDDKLGDAIEKVLSENSELNTKYEAETAVVEL